MNEIQRQEKKILVNDEIKLLDLFKSIKRQKNIFFIITFFSILISLIYAFGKKPVWQGEFQIVIDNNNTNKFQDSQASNQILGLLNINNNIKNNLLTEVKILESPSVLMEPFKFLKNQKKELGLNVSKLTYRDWLNANLKINLIEKTSVLKISYRDENKNLIIPVLNKISTSYKNYSVKEKINSLDKNEKYLEGILLKMQKKSKISMNEYQNFSILNKMSTIDNLSNSDLKTKENYDLKNNELKNIKNYDFERYKDSFLKIKELEQLLLEKKILYKEDTPIIKKLRNKIEIYKKSTSRPQEIIVRHRELERQAIRDEQVLAVIENELLKLKFDKAKEIETWELVSKPTLFETPIGHGKKIILMIGGLFGIFFGTLTSLIYEKSKGTIFKKDVFIDNLNYPLLKTFYFSEKEKWEEDIKLLLNGSLQINKIESLGLLRLNSDISFEEEYFYSNFKKEFKNKELVFTNNLIDSINCKKQIIIASSEKITENKLSSLKESINLQGVDILGWIYIEY